MLVFNKLRDWLLTKNEVKIMKTIEYKFLDNTITFTFDKGKKLLVDAYIMAFNGLKVPICDLEIQDGLSVFESTTQYLENLQKTLDVNSMTNLELFLFLFRNFEESNGNAYLDLNTVSSYKIGKSLSDLRSLCIG